MRKYFMKKSLYIKTPRLILRDYVFSDWKAVQEYASDSKVARFMPWGPNSPAQTRIFIKTVREWIQHQPRRMFDVAVLLKSENRLIGGCGIRIKNPEQREADLGYAFHRAYWGNGYATEATKALIDFGFSRLKLHRIWATCDPLNKASARVLQKAGMKREGLLRKNVFQKGAWRDSCLFAILESDRRPTH
jgi:[ribosomal protein S5]-alanine N-acetyltransferase